MGEHERPVEPFSDLHVEEGHVRAVLLHDPTIEGLDMALYLDGSGSMQDEYERKVERKGGGFLYDWFGIGKPAEDVVHPNEVEPQARWMLEYLSSKDRDGKLRVCYWACGGDGRGVELVGELEGKDVQRYGFPGPKQFGRSTLLAPAIRDWLNYFRDCVKAGARQGCAVFITDGELHDMAEIQKLSAQIAREIASGKLPRCNFILVGVGGEVKEEQMEEICHAEYPGVGHLWCHRIAEEIKELAELVAVLVDETMTVAAGGTVYDDKGNVLRAYEGRLPAVLEFEVPEGCESFTLEVAGKRYTQPLPEDHHDEAHEEEEDHH